MLLIQTTVFITGNGLREGEREGGVGGGWGGRGRLRKEDRGEKEDEGVEMKSIA